MKHYLISRILPLFIEIRYKDKDKIEFWAKTAENSGIFLLSSFRKITVGNEIKDDLGYHHRGEQIQTS